MMMMMMSPIILVFSVLNIFAKFRRGYPCGGTEHRWDINFTIFDQYLAIGEKKRCKIIPQLLWNGSLIGNDMRSIKP